MLIINGQLSVYIFVAVMYFIVFTCCTNYVILLNMLAVLLNEIVSSARSSVVYN